MSESDLMKSGGPGSRGPECRSPPAPRAELLSPSKVKDCSQNVTEKVTQVRGPGASHRAHDTFKWESVTLTACDALEDLRYHT